MKDLKELYYLKEGNDLQKNVHRILTDFQIFEKLKIYNPILVGTIPLEINILDSDLDIICCYQSQKDFMNDLLEKFGQEDKFHLTNFEIYNEPTVTANFIFKGFKFEIFGQMIATTNQYGYRHMLIEQRILEEKGELFKKQIIELKQAGLKTEPAFCKLLDIDGNPYLELLKFE